MSKRVTTKGPTKGSGTYKKTAKYVIHKGQSDPWAVKEQFVEAIHRAAAKRRKISAFTRDEADWLNSLVRSAAEDLINKG